MTAWIRSSGFVRLVVIWVGFGLGCVCVGFVFCFFF